MRGQLFLSVSVFSSLLIEFMFGGYSVELESLLVLMLLDLIAGVIVACMSKSNKSSQRGLSSKAMWAGLGKKTITLIICALAHRSDVILDLNYCFNGIVVAFCCNEAVSLLEKYTLAVGEPPQLLVKILEVMKEETENVKD